MSCIGWVIHEESLGYNRVKVGWALTGNVRAVERMEYTAIVHTVNTAVRVEGLTKALNATIAVTHAVVAASALAITCFGASQETPVKSR